MRRRLTLASEPSGTQYARLLSAAVAVCPHASLVVRPEIGLSERGERLLRALERFGLARSQVMEWPGTRLFDHAATLCWFDYGGPSQDGLLEFADALYQWRQPELPEDLCLYRADGSAWLATIAHERDAFLDLDEAEHARLLRTVPGLALRAET